MRGKTTHGSVDDFSVRERLCQYTERCSNSGLTDDRRPMAHTGRQSAMLGVLFAPACSACTLLCFTL